MSTIQIVSAPPYQEVTWHQINWAKCHRTVRRLQARIVKATQENRRHDAKTLERLLTRSFAGKAIAVRRVTENPGKHTPGVDGKTWSTPESKSAAILSLSRRGYKPLPLRRVYIPKSNNKMRPLGIPTMKDRAMQALYLLALEPVSETTADLNSYGFRPERSTADAIAQCFIALGKTKSPQWILEGDIRGCFDNINHDWLVTHIPMDKVILQKWLKAGFIDKQTLYPTEAGTPQGGVISPVLANMTLDGLERELANRFKRTERMQRVHQVNMVRYADDFIITAKSKELLEDEVKPLVEKFLMTRGLELSKEKTRITHIEEGFDFLGQNVRKYKDKLLIMPSRKNIKAFLDKVRGIVKGNMTIKQEGLIDFLNPVIRGWANYHKHIVAKKTFQSVDHQIHKLLWRWVKRRHPNKGARWIKEKYFTQVGNREWMFSLKRVQQDTSETLPIRPLFKATSVKITRHTKIRAEANPFDPQWETYFEKRLDVKMVGNLGGRRKLLYLWKEQDGICPVCYEKITSLTQWHCHHLVERAKGGLDKLNNMVLLHPNCHRQVHSQGLKVVKPVPQKGL
jgi:RNA-directed DNA polymerase